MTWMEQGGLLMWPLLALSIAALAVLIDRFIFFTTFRLPDSAKETALVEAIKKGEVATARELALPFAPAFLPLVETLASSGAAEDQERKAAICIEEIVRTLDAHTGLLAMAGRVAPLLGLLGTVLGMIQTFSRLSSSQRGAIDMTMLADGIWQALITTAAGLFIAIPAVMAHQAFLRREEAIAFSLSRLANRALAHKSEKETA